MIIIKCDRCGEQANKPYYDAGACEKVNNAPYLVHTEEGTNDTGEAFIDDRKAKQLELCKSCYELVNDAILKVVYNNESNTKQKQSSVEA